MNYKDLQAKAKELGLSYVGVSSVNLKKSIEEAGATPQDEALKTEQPKETKTPKKTKNDNVAVVYNGNNEVRRYDLETHGEGFADLANEFAKKNEYQVRFENS